jgi:ADP-ribose pyrophosphatase YjhB (NUDIX family)
VIVDSGRILLVKRANEPGRGLWAVPGGKVSLGETLTEAARREALEETGLDVEIGSVVWVGESITEHGHIVLIDFRCQVLGGELKAGDDADEARWVDVAEAALMPLTPTMYDLLNRIGAPE